MKVLFMASGYKAVYSFFEQRIVEAFRHAGHPCESYTLNQGLTALIQLQQAFQPDLILALTGLKISRPILEFLKHAKVKTAIWLTEDPYYMDLTLPISANFEYIFTIDEAALEHYKRAGKRHVYPLPLGTDPGLFHSAPVSEAFSSDICLVGVPYRNRIELVEFLLENTGYQLRIVGRGWGRQLNEWNTKGSRPVHWVNAWVQPETVMKYYNGSQIVLNIHRPPDEKYNKNRMGIMASGINNRTFDVASCEAFQLIDSREALVQHFEEGKDIVSFKDKQDFMEKVDYYMAHAEERRHMASQARRRVLSSHTFQHRIDVLIEQIQSN